MEVQICSCCVDHHWRLDNWTAVVLKIAPPANQIIRFLDIHQEFGNEVDRVSGLPSFQALLDNKKKIRRATEEAGIPFTYVSANSFAAYFVDYLLHPHDKSDQDTLYGTGEARGIYLKSVRKAMRSHGYKPCDRMVVRINVLQKILQSCDRSLVQPCDRKIWFLLGRKKTGRTMKRIHVPEEEIVKLSESLPFPDSIRVSILHNIFIAGAQMSFELTEKDLEASQLYPDYNFTCVDEFLNIFLVNPPKPKLAAFA
ncbi:NmrA-like negative transcriptional regulator family protein [Abeliophyllum distichum]|uniref:NmrA-like negative transcriptional regulator family protein n=1 Tax=Abeliophyllum distichum TaxID=126358 RepID=A0ABD1SD27_9LAMI